MVHDSPKLYYGDKVLKYVLVDASGTEYGPYSVSELLQLANEGRLIPDSVLRREDGITTTASAVLSYWKTKSSAGPTQFQSYETSDIVELNYASKGSRVGAAILDVIVHMIITWPMPNEWPWQVFALINSSFDTFFYLMFQATIGKLILGLRIVDLDGEKPNFGQILKRQFVSGSYLGGISMFFDPHGRHWGEKWAGTATISIRK